MKKALLFIMVLGALGGRNSWGADLATVADFNMIQAQMHKNDEAGIYNPILAEGVQGDFLIQLSATPELIEIYSKQKTVKFLSVENPMQYITDGYCLINIIPYNTMIAMGTPDNRCSYRLFCGGASDMDNDVYAVELCGE